MSKIKLLIVTISLAQGGNERWIYETCKAIDKEKFEIAILSSKKYLYTKPEIDFDNFYYHQIKKLNIPVYEYLENYIGLSRWKRVIQKARRKFYDISHGCRIDMGSQIRKLIESFDVICILDTYNYNLIKPGIHQLKENKFFIVLHTHKVQLDFDMYACFDKGKSYRFAYHSDKQIRELAESGVDLKKNRFFYCPLTLDISDYPYLFNPIWNETVLISVFSRIAFSRSMDVFIEAFAKIQKSSRFKYILNIYGETIDEEYHQHLLQLIDAMKIDKNLVRFMGHAQNIADTLKRDKVNICWGLINDLILGYGSIEVAAMGVPSVFWDVDESINKKIVSERTDDSLVVANNIEDFVAANVKYTADNELLAELAKKQREYIIKKYDIASSIRDFENYVASIKESIG